MEACKRVRHRRFVFLDMWTSTVVRLVLVKVDDLLIMELLFHIKVLQKRLVSENFIVLRPIYKKCNQAVIAAIPFEIPQKPPICSFQK